MTPGTYYGLPSTCKALPSPPETLSMVQKQFLITSLLPGSYPRSTPAMLQQILVIHCTSCQKQTPTKERSNKRPQKRPQIGIQQLGTHFSETAHHLKQVKKDGWFWWIPGTFLFVWLSCLSSFSDQLNPMCCVWTGVLCWVEWRKSIAKIRLSTKNRSLSHSTAVVSSCFVEISKNWIRITPAETNIDSRRPFYSPNKTRIFVVTAHLWFHLEQHFSTTPFSHNVSVSVHSW